MTRRDVLATVATVAVAAVLSLGVGSVVTFVTQHEPATVCRVIVP